MMNLLLVDDQTSVLEGMLNGVDFESLGYTKVYTEMCIRDRLILGDRLHKIQLHGKFFSFLYMN